MKFSSVFTANANKNQNNFWIRLNKPIFGLAPMDGVTDMPMRQIQIKVKKPDILYTEFISIEGFVRNREAFERKLSFDENERPIIVQIFGYTPKDFYEAVLRIAQMGFDGIDINMGCPSKKILRKGGGGALIGNKKLAGKIIESCLKALSDSKTFLPLSVKTRIGKNKIITKDWLSFLTSFPLAEITLHGRLLNQGIDGPVNWKEIQIGREIVQNKGIIFLGNGGIKSIKEARKISEMLQLDGVLIGRAACGNPWVFKENYIPAKNEILDIILDHAKLVNDFYPPEKFITILKHFSWYSKGFKGNKQLKLELLKCKGLRETEKTIQKYREF